MLGVEQRHKDSSQFVLEHEVETGFKDHVAKKTFTHHVRSVNDVGKRIRDGEFPVIAHHRHQFHKSLEPFG